MKFSIGYNYNIKTLGLLDTYANKIEALYFPIPRQYFNSGRDIEEPSLYIGQIPKIIKKCRSLNIMPQLLLNPTCEGEHGLTKAFFEKMLNFIKSLKDKGLSSIIITNPVYISRIRQQLKDIKIESSVNCFVRTVEHALYLKDLGVDVLTIDRDINRNIPLIKEIKNKTGLKIRMMLNEGCLRNCPYRVSHYNFLSHGINLQKISIQGIFVDKFCIELYLKDPSRVFRAPFIPPDALGYYDQFIDHYKLSTRVFSTERIETCLNAYINRSFTGNLLEILDCSGLSFFEYIDYGILRKCDFFKNMLDCNLKCNKCNYCKRLFKKAALISRNYFDKRSEDEEKKSIMLYKKDLKGFCSTDKKSRNYFKIGEAYFKLHRYKEAVENIKIALKLNSKLDQARVILGFCYEFLRNYKGAIKELMKIKNVGPQDRNINLALARCYKSTGKKALFDEEIKKVFQNVQDKFKIKSAT